MKRNIKILVLTSILLILTAVCAYAMTAIPTEKVEEKMVYTLEDKDEFSVIRDGDEYLVEGPAVERLMGRINIGDNESMHYFQKVIRNLGIEEELKKKGVKIGDTVKFLEWEFEWEE